VAAFLLSAVGSTGWETSIALSADHLLAVEFAGKSLEGRFDKSTTKTENKMQG